VEPDVGEQIPRRLGAVERVVDVQRDPGERDPVRLVGLPEGPPEALRAEAVAQVRVLDHVDGIVVAKELVVPDLTEHSDRECDETQRDQSARHSGDGPR
jgi:hypothetical protein